MTGFKIGEKHADVCKDGGNQAHVVLYFQFRYHMEHRERYFKLGLLIGPICFKDLSILQQTCPTVKLCCLNGWRKLGLQAHAQPRSTGRYQSSNQQHPRVAGLAAPPKAARIRERTSHKYADFKELWK